MGRLQKVYLDSPDVYRCAQWSATTASEYAAHVRCCRCCGADCLSLVASLVVLLCSSTCSHSHFAYSKDLESNVSLTDHSSPAAFPAAAVLTYILTDCWTVLVLLASVRRSSPVLTAPFCSLAS